MIDRDMEDFIRDFARHCCRVDSLRDRTGYFLNHEEHRGHEEKAVFSCGIILVLMREYVDMIGCLM